MRRSLSILFALVVAIVFSLAAAAPASAQGKKAKKDEGRVSGTVQMINKDTSTITVRERRTNVNRQVVYNADTKFTDRENKPAKMEDLKDGRRVIAVGAWNDKTQLVAKTISIRE